MRPIWKAISRYRPRLLTFLVLIVIAAMIVLANLSDDVRRRVETSPLETPADLHFDARVLRPGGREIGLWNVSYGWPFLWRQYVVVLSYGAIVLGEVHSSGRLAGNLAIWLLLVAVPAAACEWLLRRYRPRFRWSLRTMLAAIGCIAACCGWFAMARNRAISQDPLIAAIGGGNGRVWVERWGPDWLDVVGADRLRRRIIAASLGPSNDLEAVEDCLSGLARVPKLQYLSFRVERLTPRMASALHDMRHLQMLNIDVSDRTPTMGRDFAYALKNKAELRALCFELTYWPRDDDAERLSGELLDAINHVTRLEALYLSSTMLYGQGLSRLAGLTNLKSLTLDSVLGADDPAIGPPLLSRLPSLPRLEALDLRHSEIGDRDLPYLARLPRLKSLGLLRTLATGAGLAKLRSLQSLDELVIDRYMVTVEGLESLQAIKHLRSLHIEGIDAGPQRMNALPYVPKFERDDCLRALDGLRRSKAGLTIDGETGAVAWSGQFVVPSEYEDANRPQTWSPGAVVRRWKEEQATKAASGQK